MEQINVARVIESCDTLQRRTIIAEGCMHSSSRCFDACMRAFDSKPPAEAVTFRVYFNVPVMQEGTATIHRDGHMVMRIGSV